MQSGQESRLIEKKDNYRDKTLTTKMPYELKLDLSFDASFNYLKDGKLITINTLDMPALIKQGLIRPITQKIRMIDFEPTLETHGFEVRILPKAIQNMLSAYQRASADEQRLLRESIRESLESLTSEHFGLPAVAFDTVYRNTDEEKNTVFKSVPLVHIDFPRNKIGLTLNAFSKEWQPRVLKKLGDKFNKDQLEFMVNIWMPLDTIKASPLVVCSNENIRSDRFFEYNAVRRDGSKFKAVSLTPPEPNKNDPWFFQPGMKGSCYMFFSTKGIHSAAKFPSETSARESIEVRLGLFKK